MKEYFYNVSSYNRFVKCKQYADKVNSLLKEGYIVIDDEGEVVVNQFEFDGWDCGMGISCDSIYYIGDMYDEDSMLTVVEAHQKDDFIKKLKQYKAVKPDNIERITF